MRRAISKVRLLAGTYPTQERFARWSEGKTPALCLLCKTADETVIHFLLECPALHKARLKQLSLISAAVASKVDDSVWAHICTDSELLVKLVLDCTWLMDANLIPNSPE